MDGGIWHDLIESTSANAAGNRFAGSIADYAAQGWLIVDKQGYCVYANRIFLEMTGFSFEELQSQPIHDLIHHHHPDGTFFHKEECLLHRSFKDNSLFTQREEFIFYRKDGTPFNASCRATPVHEDGETAYMVLEVRDLTYLKEAHLQQFRLNVAYRLAAELTQMGIWERDLSTDLVTHCPVASRILGISEEAATVPVSFLEKLILPEDLPMFGSTLKAIIAAGQPFDLEFRIRHSDGQVRWIATRGMGIKEGDGTPTRVTGVIFDITEKKHSQEELRGNEITYQLATEASKIGAWERDFSSNVSKISPLTAEILGLPREKTVLLPAEWQAMIVQEDMPMFRQAEEAALRTGNPFELEFRLRRPNGQCVWVSSRGIIERNDNGVPLRALGVMIDITDKKNAEEELRQSNERLSRILQSSSEGIFGMGPDHSLIFVNLAGAAMLGYAPEELIGRQIHTQIHHHRSDGSPYPEEECRIIDAVDRGQSIRVEDEVFWRKDGSCFPVSYSVAPTIIDNRPYGAVIIFSDIADRKQDEERERQAANDVRAAAEANAKFQAFFQQGSNYSALLAADGTVIEINRKALDACGYTRSEVIGKKFWECGWWNRSQAVAELIKRACLEAATGNTFHQEVEYFLSDGSRRFTDLLISPVADDHGTILYIACTGLDITERKWAEAALRSSEERYRTLFNSADEGFCIVEVLFNENTQAYDLRFLETNPAFEKQLGLKNVVGKRLREFLPVLEKNWADFYTQVATTGKPQRIIEYSPCLGRWFDVFASRLSGDSSNRLAILFKDVTEQKNALESMRASEERFRSLITASTQMVWITTPEGKNVIDSPTWRAFTGQSFEEWQNFGWLNAIHPDDQQPTLELWQKCVAEHKAFKTEYRVRRHDGEYRWTSVSAVPIVDSDGTVKEWVGTNTDITEQKRAAEQVIIANNRLNLAIEGTGEGIWDWDIQNNTFKFSGGLNKILGYKEANFVREASEWHKLIHPEDYERVTSTFQAAMEEKTPIYECEYRLKAKDGHWKWIWARGVIVERDRDGKPLTMTGTLADITAKKQSDELAWRHANLDSLTSLPNRRYFRERLEMEMARAKRTGHSLALIFLDLDGFKQVNDLFGHDAGDLLLLEAAHRLKGCVRETDTVARLGGDEFTLILTELADLGNVEYMCQKIITNIAEPFQLEKDLAYVSASIGVALSPLDALTADELIRKADQAMYAAKRAGKNQFHYFTKEMDEKAHMHLKITNELRHALRHKQLTVHYQPVIDLKVGRIVKAEALLRWNHPALGEIGPSEFIPIAEESGLIRQIGNWVFREAALCCKHCSDHAQAPFQIGVNKSPIQFMARDADANWLQYLQELGLPGDSISVEITEGVLLRDSTKVADKLSEYRDAGVQVALDDFGTGYCSMSYLQKFEIDYVKIDQSFVQNLMFDPNSQTIAETIIMMAHKLGKEVIAEGIETQEQLDYLIRAGCDYGQGFLFSHAVPEEELIKMVSNTNLNSVHSVRHRMH